MSNLSPDQFREFNHVAEYARSQGRGIQAEENTPTNPMERLQRTVMSRSSKPPPTRWINGNLVTHPLLTEN